MDKTGRTEMEMYFVKQVKQVKKEKKKTCYVFQSSRSIVLLGKEL